MRQILSGFLATAMIVSVASSVSFAASASAKFTLPMPTGGSAITVTPTSTVTGASGTLTNESMTVTPKFDSVKFTLKDGGTEIGTISVDVNKELTAVTDDIGAGGGTPSFTALVATLSDAELASALDGKTFANAKINNKFYSGKLVKNGTSVEVIFDNNTKIDSAGALTVTADLNISATASTGAYYDDSGTQTPVTIDSITYANNTGISATVNSQGTGTETSDVTTNGDYLKNLGIRNVVYCYDDGSPMPIAENPYGIDKDLNNENGAQSGTTLYFMINDEVDSKFADDTYWKMKITKGDNAKIIKKVSDVTKTFNKTMYDAYNGKKINDIDFSVRHRFVKVELNEIYTDDEYKCTLDLRMSPTSKAQSRYEKDGIAIEDAEIKIKDFSFYVKNIVKPADNDWKVGVGGLMLNPLENDWNEVTYFDEDGDLAFMKFFADSDVSKFYAKLSTKWEHADYASYFNDQDAYMFDFVGSPKISATSRCDLQIYNPFINADGDETIDPESAVIYQVIDGDLYDVTDNFTYQEGDNGDMAFCTRTRFLGTYIICEKAVEEAVDDSEEVPEIAPEEQTPEEVTPGGDNGGKVPANTGKWA